MYIDGEGTKEAFIDAALGCNNPTEEAIKEVQYNLCGIASHVNCVVSIGTGSGYGAAKPSPTLSQQLQENAFDSQQVHQSMASRFQSQPETYFRFDVTSGMEDIWIGDLEMVSKVRSCTLQYLSNVETRESLAKVTIALARKLEGLGTQKFPHVMPLPSMCLLHP